MSEKQSRTELLDKIEKAAHDYERDFHGCSRCVLKPLQDHLGLGDDSSLKASTTLAAGVAMRGETCWCPFSRIAGRRDCYSKRGPERYRCPDRFFSSRVQIGQKVRNGIRNHELYEAADR